MIVKNSVLGATLLCALSMPSLAAAQDMKMPMPMAGADEGGSTEVVSGTLTVTMGMRNDKTSQCFYALDETWGLRRHFTLVVDAAVMKAFMTRRFTTGTHLTLSGRVTTTTVNGSTLWTLRVEGLGGAGAPIPPTPARAESLALGPPGPSSVFDDSTPSDDASQTLLAIIVNFRDARFPGNTQDVASDIRAVSEFYDAASHHVVNFRHFRVAGPYDIDGTSTSADFGPWSAMADQAYRAETGKDPNRYHHKVYFLAANVGFSGFGTVGGFPSSCWVFSTFTTTLAHELGHNIGGNHASSQRITGENYSEYGDGWDPLGAPNELIGWNAPHQIQFHFMPVTRVTDVNVGTTGTYRLWRQEDRLADTDTTLQVLTIRRVGLQGDPYYISYRGRSGFDAGVPDPRIDQKVHVHTWDGSGNTVLRRILPKGDTFIDPVNGIRISVRQDTAAEAATLDVSVQEPHGVPVAQLSPQNNPAATPGDSFSYQLSVTNTDTVDHSYDLSPRGPDAVLVLDKNQLTVAAGATGTTLLRCTPGKRLSPDTYDVGVAVSQSDLPEMQVGAHASFTILKSLTEASMTPRSQPARRGTPLVYTISLANNAGSATTYTLEGKAVAGVNGIVAPIESASMTPATVTLAPGEKASAVFQFTPSEAIVNDDSYAMEVDVRDGTGDQVAQLGGGFDLRPVPLVMTPRSQPAVRGVPMSYRIVVTNTSGQDRTYTLLGKSVPGLNDIAAHLESVTMTPATLTLAAGESAEAVLQLTPSNDIPKDDSYAIEVDVTDDQGNVLTVGGGFDLSGSAPAPGAASAGIISALAEKKGEKGRAKPEAVEPGRAAPEDCHRR
jgi:hypothetical protein